MTIALYQKPVETRPAESSPFSSRMLHHYIQYLEKRPGSHICDMGPTCGDNIRFFAFRVGRLSVCNGYSHLVSFRDTAKKAPTFARLLDFSSEQFDGINVWDLPDHCSDSEFAELITVCRSRLKPGGLLLMMACSAADAGQPHPTFLRIGNLASVEINCEYSQSLPCHHRTNRDLCRAVEPLALYKSFVYTNGYREFLFRNG